VATSVETIRASLTAPSFGSTAAAANRTAPCARSAPYATARLGAPSGMGAARRSARWRASSCPVLASVVCRAVPTSSRGSPGCGAWHAEARRRSSGKGTLGQSTVREGARAAAVQERCSAPMFWEGPS